MPFSACSVTVESGGRWSGMSVGRPMPRLTYSPSRSSSAARAAIWSRVQAMSARLLADAGGALLDVLAGGLVRGEGDDALHENAGQVHVVGVDLADLDHAFRLDDGEPAGHRGGRVEVAGGGVEDAVARPVRDGGAHE